ncbi:polymorphic toxin-type HINT domain-containing protein [Adhaeretor mobilis]|uniref:Hint domain-containing protein n=1 Tax=Adhaeretor mobilis TaxID=1930276 RepID=A0A517MRR9_9BACT|nr:polymorphic toxin-type HINT domain-containing protein [Adhaeretor mobilis]QDS97578.1 hypothetical protein HG15A2_08410 [Adhaeretor mobilis]
MKKQIAYVLLLSCWGLLGTPSVQIAFAAEVNRDAVPAVPNSELARWHSGQVFFDGQWRHVEQVQQLVSTDSRWQDYQQHVNALDGSIEAHVDLAHWCNRNRLVHEEKLQWLYVLQANPNHSGALKGLRLIRYRDQLYSLDHVDQLKQQEKAAEESYQKFKPLLLALRRSAKSGSKSQREAAFAQLAAVSDPTAIPALMEVAKLKFGRADSPPSRDVGNKANSFQLELQQAAITSLRNISSHEATLKLVEIAVLSPFRQIRCLAAESLIPHKKTSYMPLLMTSLTAPLEADIGIQVSPNGMLLLSEHIAEVGPEAEWVTIRDSNYFSRTYFARQQKVAVNHNVNRSNALARAQQTQRKVAATNYSRHQWNTRIDEVLQTTTGQSVSNVPQDWWDYWKDYNELAYPEETPTYVSSQYESYDQCNLSLSCFAAGTPVWTLKGPTPIEWIQVGDLVLSQDPATGCLDYRPVMHTTVRPPSPSINLKLEDETIVSTRGHRFWVIGEGWRMAKHLNAGDRLHGADLRSSLEMAVEGSEVEAFNLVVGEYHTYFVGNSRLLVHDNGCPSAVRAIAPGIKSDSIVAAVNQRAAPQH